MIKTRCPGRLLLEQVLSGFGERARGWLPRRHLATGVILLPTAAPGPRRPRSPGPVSPHPVLSCAARPRARSAVLPAAGRPRALPRPPAPPAAGGGVLPGSRRKGGGESGGAPGRRGRELRARPPSPCWFRAVGSVLAGGVRYLELQLCTHPSAGAGNLLGI